MTLRIQTKICSPTEHIITVPVRIIRNVNNIVKQNMRLIMKRSINLQYESGQNLATARLLSDL